MSSAKELSEYRKVAGLCESCGAVSIALTYCGVCRRRKNALRRAAYVPGNRPSVDPGKNARVALRKEYGLCVQCGAQARPFAHCLWCRVKIAAGMKRWRNRKGC